MIKLWFAPRTRSVRIAWLLEELEQAYEIERVAFEATSSTFFKQNTPSGKLPYLEDGEVSMGESGAIVEYLIEKYGQGRLAPAVGTPERASYLQWIHYADSTLFSPIGIVVWLTLYRNDADSHPELVEDAKARSASGFEYLEQQFGDGPWLLGEKFSAADVMMGFTLLAAQQLGILDQRYPKTVAYVGRLLGRPALVKAVSL